MKRLERYAPVLIAVLVAIGCGGGKPQDASATTEATPEAPTQLAQAPAGQPAAGGGSASVKGSVRFEGEPPKPEQIQMAADPVCQQQHPEPVTSEAVVVNDNNTLRHVFVYVKAGAQGPFQTPNTPVTLDQHGCGYKPHVFGIQVNQPLEIVNSDPTLHNVNSKPTKNQPFNVAQPVKGMKTTKKFTKPELGVSFKCNVHPWMQAYGHVLEHPFFGVTGPDGAFAISGLPAGTYEVEAWHEKYGTQTQSVSVADGESKSVDFTFKAK
ncbi:MAG: carboxypeptidase regulatory-like domain-containing protein [Candidatus Omnitrophica bacterium]|nr:carboxypeptidase regulatory-like domain-containing protein [Candidatus Omnitrophota bacterium]